MFRNKSLQNDRGCVRCLTKLRQAWLFIICTILAAGCGRDMADQPHKEPLEGSTFFADGKASRDLVPGTVARGYLKTDTAFYDGRQNGQFVSDFPLSPVAKKLGLEGNDQQLMKKILERGQERYNIFCAPCHDRSGSGFGMVVQRGFPAPPSFHINRLRQVPIGHFYDVTTNGFGRMPDYASQIPTPDRWAIVAYVQALQLSQHAKMDDLPEQDQKALIEKGSPQ